MGKFSRKYVAADYARVPKGYRGGSRRKLYSVALTFRYCDSSGIEHTIPYGFQTDFMSAAWYYRWLINFYVFVGIIPAGIFDCFCAHDGWCQNPAFYTKQEADALFMEAMDAVGVPRFFSKRIYAYVQKRGLRTDWPQPMLTKGIYPGGIGFEEFSPPSRTIGL